MSEKAITKEELFELLGGIAEKDLSEGADIDDHPCSVIMRYYEELESKVLRKQDFNMRGVTLTTGGNQ